MAAMDSNIAHADDFIDESGWTSMEPEGAGHHPHDREDWRSATPEDHPTYHDRWEGTMDPHDLSQRGPQPVEGDGSGAPG
jgi:hypothetical protein